LIELWGKSRAGLLKDEMTFQDIVEQVLKEYEAITGVIQARILY
jgi:hypothetical protein